MTRDELWKLRERVMDRAKLYDRTRERPGVGIAVMDCILVEELLDEVKAAIDELIDVKDAERDAAVKDHNDLVNEMAGPVPRR